MLRYTDGIQEGNRQGPFGKGKVSEWGRPRMVSHHMWSEILTLQTMLDRKTYRRVGDQYPDGFSAKPSTEFLVVQGEEYVAESQG
jgi:hypothetical protein